MEYNNIEEYIHRFKKNRESEVNKSFIIEALYMLKHGETDEDSHPEKKLMRESEIKNIDRFIVGDNDHLTGEDALDFIYGAMLRQARKDAGMTQEDLAKKLECKRERISDWENAKHRPSNANQKLLAMIFEELEDIRI